MYKTMFLSVKPWSHWTYFSIWIYSSV